VKRRTIWMWWLMLAAMLLLPACGDDDSNGGGEPEPLALTAAAAPVALNGIEADFYPAIAYGPHAENLFDIYLPASDEPTPLLLYIHGGGFVGGSRDTASSADLVRSFLAEGIAFASIDYRLLRSPDPEGVIKSLLDSSRALQFLRYHSRQLNIDPDQVVLMGGSAGAGTSLWIGFNDDLSDPDNADPVLRQTTRVDGVIAIATQATYDIGRWKTDVFEEYRVDILGLANALGLAQALFDFYGITEFEQFNSPAILAYRERVDMLQLMDAEDPQFFVRNDLEPAITPLSVDLAFHHANHALTLSHRADEVGLDHVAYIRALGIEDPSGEDPVAFALRVLGEM